MQGNDWLSHRISHLSERVGSALKQRQWVMTTAESCTGGGIAAAVTEISGSSSWFQRSFVTYSNEAKSEMLRVPESDLVQYGAVSFPVVFHMARGALENSHADVSVAVSGIAGPDGGSPEKPVGTVFIGWCWREHNGQKALLQSNIQAVSYRLCRHVFEGDRQEIRLKTQYYALLGILRICST